MQRHPANSLIKNFAWLLILTACAWHTPAQEPLPRVLIHPAASLRLPGGRQPEAGIEDAIDSNCPVEWNDAGQMLVFASVAHPFRSSGANLFSLRAPSIETTIERLPELVGGVWLEATYRDANGVLFGWYHNEQAAGCDHTHLAIPSIGALVSYDDGLTWYDLGFVLTAPADSFTCDTKNYYFAGGNGDFSVIADEAGEYLYFIFGAYHAQTEEQGICLARMPYASRFAPSGNVWKWHNDAWEEPGLQGRVTPIIGVEQDWHSATPEAFWGPSVHYNTHLEQYVMLLNHAVDPFWAQEGVYLAYNRDLADPRGWSAPARLDLDPELRAYPELIGLAQGETDKRMGQVGRLFLLGESNWELEFLRPDEISTLVTPRRPSTDSHDLPTRKPETSTSPSRPFNRPKL